MLTRPTVSLCVIHRRGGAGLAELVASIRLPDGRYQFDELVFVDTGPRDTDPQSEAARHFLAGLARELPGRVVLADYEAPDEVEVDGKRYITDFATARNMAHELASGEWTAFLDTDDVFELDEHLPSLIAALPPATTALWTDYVYAPSLYQPRAFAWRESLPWRWSGALHEQRSVPGEVEVILEGPYGRIVHHGDPDGSSTRNMAILRHLLERDGNLPPDLLLSYGAGLAGEGARGAAAIFDDVLSTADDISQVYYKACLLAAQVASDERDFKGAVGYLGRAIVAQPAWRTAYLELAFIERALGDHKGAMHYFRLAYAPDRCEAPIGHSRDREERLGRLAAALSASALGLHDEAWGFLPEKDDPQVLGTRLAVLRARGDAEAVESVGKLVRYLVSCDEVDRAVGLLDAVPHRLVPQVESSRALVRARVGHLHTQHGYAALYEPVRPIDMACKPDARKIAQVGAVVAACEQVPRDITLRVLEVGCGNAWVLSEVAARVGRPIRAVGVEVGRGRADVAREVAGVGVEVVVGSVEDPDFVAVAAHALGGAAHVVLMAEVLEHVADPGEVLGRLRLLTQAHGQLILTTPDAERYGACAPQAWRTDLDDTLLTKYIEHVRVYDCHRLVAELEEAGWRVHSVEPHHEHLLMAQATPHLPGSPVADLVEYAGPTRRRLDIYAPSPLEWGPHAHEHGFIGGSEQAVCHLAPLLADRSWDVHVYATILDREAWHRGVYWHHLDRFDLEAHRDVLVVWRDVRALRRFAQAGHPVVYWAHDVADPVCAPVYDLARVILTLSPYHTEQFRAVVSDHVSLVELGNGVDVPHLPVLPEAEAAARDDRDPHRAIYCSSASRGLLALLRMWPSVRAEVPDARLEVCYDLGLLRHPKTPSFLRGLADEVERLGDATEGVIFHGGLPQRNYLHLASHCGVWTYPTVFPEVYCIVAAEMQALGLIPVTTDKGALATTVLTGSVLPWEHLAADLELSEHQVQTGHIYHLAPGATSARFVRMIVDAMHETPSRVRGGSRIAGSAAWNEVPELPARWGATERLKLSRAAAGSYAWARTAGAADRALHETMEKDQCPQPRPRWAACSARSRRSPSPRPPRRP